MIRFKHYIYIEGGRWKIETYLYCTSLIFEYTVYLNYFLLILWSLGRLHIGCNQGSVPALIVISLQNKQRGTLVTSSESGKNAEIWIKGLWEIW